MSNELSLFSNGGGIPAHLQRKELSNATKALMGGGSGKRLSIRGGSFRKVINGQEVMRSDDRAINVVIVAAAPETSRQWYKDPYQEGVMMKPDCWSNDGEKPDPLSEIKQSNSCLTCPQNIAGSGQNESRACRYLHRIAVVLENDLHSGDIYGMSIAATSLFGKGEAGKMPLKQYSKLLGGHRLDISDVVTEIRFDTDSATPKLVFSAVRALEEDEIETVIEYSESEEAHQAISFMDTSHEIPGERLQPLFPPKVAQAAPSPAPVETQPVPEEAVGSSKRRTVRASPAKPVDRIDPTIEEPTKRPTPAKAEPTNLDAILGEWGEE